MKTNIFSVRLGDKLLTKLQKAAKAQYITPSQLLRIALEAYLKKHNNSDN
jgi:metal-responsive CopG/Arc/MetJ family transcriptional regulator